MKQVFKSIFSSDGTISSKRVFGGVGFIIYIIMFCIDPSGKVDTTLLFVSSSLLGLETMVNGFKSKVPTDDSKTL